MKKLLKTFLFLLLTGLIYLNIGLYFRPEFKSDSNSKYNLDVYYQLQFLKQKLAHGEGARMQKFFPEGLVFINAMYGLAWGNLIEDLPNSSKIYKEGIKEINRAIKEIDSPSGRAPFVKKLPIEYGAFYAGWSTYLIGSKLLRQKEHDQKQLYYFKNKCYAIAEGLKKATHPYLESYPGQAWPADNVVCLAALVQHDQIFEPEFEEIIQNWLSLLKNNLEPKTGLIPHVVDSKTGKPMGPARGCSQSLMINFLHKIDPLFAKVQFDIYKNLFLDSRFFLPGIREYPKGINGSGDVDSGPVILDIGGAASIVGQRTFGLFGDRETFIGLRNCIESFGCGYTLGEGKKYIFGMLPMADAFIAWANSTEKEDWKTTEIRNWRSGFQIFSVVLILIIGAVFIYMKKPPQMAKT